MYLTDYVRSLSDPLILSGNFRRFEAYCSTTESVVRFCDTVSASPRLKNVFTRVFLRNYQTYLIQLGCKRNTVTFYISSLRSVYARALEAELVPLVPNLFSDVSTRVDPGVKRAFPTTFLSRIFTADLSSRRRLEPCRDYFVLSLLLQGISFTDLAHLRRSDICDGVVRYHRRKTGGLVEVSLLPEARALFNKYAYKMPDSPYLLPIVTLSGVQGHRQYQSALHRQNRQLLELAAHLGIKENLTTYVARHSWATIAYHNGVDIGVVSQGMGHHAESVTRTYLASFGKDRLAEANYIVLDAILGAMTEDTRYACREVEEQAADKSVSLSVATSESEIAKVVCSEELISNDRERKMLRRVCKRERSDGEIHRMRRWGKNKGKLLYEALRDVVEILVRCRRDTGAMP